MFATELEKETLELEKEQSNLSGKVEEWRAKEREWREKITDDARELEKATNKQVGCHFALNIGVCIRPVRCTLAPYIHI